MTIPYTPNPASIPRFFAHIQTAGVPTKVTQAYLKSVGFKSSNDRYLIGIVKAVGFATADGVPTDRWRDYRDRSKQRAVMADAVRAAYADLFKTYPDAERKDAEALRNFFSAHSALAENTLKLAVATFKSLAGLGDFTPATGSQARPSAQPAASAAPEAMPIAPRSAFPAGAPTIHVNIELHLPATDDGAIYDKLFESMRKHLLTPIED